MTDDEILAAFTDIVRRVLGQPDLIVTRETTARDVAGWDSLKQVIIILETEERFDLSLASREIDRVKCVGDFLDLIAAKT